MLNETPYVQTILSLDEPLTLEFLTRASTIFPDLLDYLKKDQKEIKSLNISQGCEENLNDEVYRHCDGD